MRTLIAAVAMAAIAAGCRHAPPRDGVPANEHAVRGVMSVTGTSFAQQLMLQTDAAAIRLYPASESDSSALVRLGGVELAVRGSDVSGGLRVREFTAVSVGGKPVVDGIIRIDGTAVSLVTRGGVMTIGNPPTALLRLGGSRVWIEGPLATGPNSYGVITPR